MTPEQLARSGTEHAEQTALFCWANMVVNFGFAMADAISRGEKTVGIPIVPVPELRWLHAIPNAGARGNKIAAAQLKAEGVKAGVADCLLPVRRSWPNDIQLIPSAFRWYNGFYLEMKRKNGSLSDVTKDQTDFMCFVKEQGYYWNVAFGWRMGADMIQRYLECR